MSKIKTCIVCGKKYEYCGHCDRTSVYQSWRSNYCSENCREVFKVCSDYVGNVINQKDAKAKLVKLDTSMSNIAKAINQNIKDIMAYKDKENAIVNELDNTDQDEKPKYTRPRRRRTKPTEE